ncbi:MAG TPA: ankyrin repeat domain-containing protein, partial [Vicinamibacterales bacterium]|nr:ankyrin repeat domain-containing protein [Vicinamibacterales bacterium]
MADRSLPARPDLDQYKKQAKELVKAAGAGDAEASARIRAHHPRPSATAPRLADAQLTIAREHGFESWPRFVREIEARLGDESPRAIWQAAERALEAGDADALERLLREHGATLRRGPARTSWLGGLQPDFSPADAKSIIASNHEFESWDAFAAFAEARRQPGSPVAQFEDAVDAIVQGNTDALKQLLERNPDLVRARSMRKHHSHLLHYVSANGVEGFRQRTPKNAVQVLEVLLDAGAEVNAKADMYGGSTTVGLVATSIHPQNAGVQNDLIDVLIAHGAHIDRPGAGGGTANLINSCLANGRPGAAEYLARRGAPIDLEGAAGLGRLDLVRQFFDSDGHFANSATAEQMKDGFSWACEYGRTEVVEFLLTRGVDVGARLRPHQQTGLHWAAIGPHVETVRLLLRRGSPIDVRDESFGVTALEWTLYGWGVENRRDESGAYYD